MTERVRYTQRGKFAKDLPEEEVDRIIKLVLADKMYLSRLGRIELKNLRSPNFKTRRRGYDSVCTFERRLEHEGVIKQASD